MNIDVRPRDATLKPSSTSSTATSIPSSRIEQMRPFLSNQWWSYLQTYGNRSRHGYAKGYAYPKMTPQAARRDAWPPGGGLPASDLDFLRQQHLDLYGISAAIMNPLSPTGQGDMNVELSVAMATAANEAQLHLDRPRAAAEVLGGGALRGRRGVRRRDPPPRRQQGFRAGVHAEPHRRGRRPQALLADLRGRGRSGAAGRHPRLRLLAAGRCQARAIRRSTSRR